MPNLSDVIQENLSFKDQYILYVVWQRQGLSNMVNMFSSSLQK